MELLPAVRNSFTSAAVTRAAAHLGEAEGPVRRGLDQAIPSVLAAILHCISDTAGANRFIQVLGDSHHHDHLLTDLPAILSSRHSATAMLALGERTTRSLFGTLAQPVAQAIAEECEIQMHSAWDLLRLTALVTLEHIGREARRSQFTQQQLLDALGKQRGVAARALPPEVAKHITLYENPEVPAEAPGETEPLRRPRRLLPFKLFA
jgi:hypothetical protein